MDKTQLEQDILYIPINPFSNDTAPITLDLILYEYDDDYGNFICSPVHKKILHYNPFPKYFHICDLKFHEVKNIKEHQNYFYCFNHNKLYNKYINSGNTKEIFCEECQTDEFDGTEIQYFEQTKLNWEKFDINKNKVMNIIMKLIQEFYPKEIKQFNKDDFCKIETEKIIRDNVNNILYNKEYDELFNKKLKLLILDFNSFIVSALKIFKTNKYYNKNYLYNIDLFEDIDFPQIFNFNSDIKSFDSVEKFLEKETFKENICTSLKNMIYYDKILENQEEKIYSILREQSINTIKKIDNKENFLVSINDSSGEIYDNKGNLILDRFNLSNNDIIVINNNLIITIWYFGIIDLISFEPGIKVDKEDIKNRGTNFGQRGLRGRGEREKGRIIRNRSEQNYVINYKNIINYDNNVIYKTEWLDEEKILVILTKNYLAFYYINSIDNINNFDIIKQKEFNNKNELNINLHDIDYLDFNVLNMVYNSYNSTLFISYLEYEENTDKTFLHFYIFDIKSLSIINQFDIESKYYEEYNINILNEYTLIILFNNGIIYTISLKTFQIVTIFEVLKNNVNTDYYYSKLNINIFNFKNDKKFVIFNYYNVKLFGFYPPYEIIEENINDDKYKYLELDMFNKKNYCLNYIESLNDSGKYAIGYSQFYQFFQHKYFFKTYIKIVGK